jgi:hypothetical protein
LLGKAEWTSQRQSSVETTVAFRETQAFSRTPRKTTNKCRRARHRKLIRISARGSAYRIAIPFGGIGRDRVKAIKYRSVLLMLHALC